MSENNTSVDNKNIELVIVGAGFGGIRTALELEKKHLANVHVTLVSDKPHFEYNPALYRYVTGNSAIEVCIPLTEIFKNKNVTVVDDKIVALNKGTQELTGVTGKTYHYDHLVLALGSETTYFGIAGLKENSFGMKTVSEALHLKEQITKTLFACKENAANKADQTRDANFVIIGAGPTGVEMAGRLIEYARRVAREIELDPSLVSVSIIEGAPKILPSMPAKFTDVIEGHLRMLGVNLFLNRVIERQEVEEVYLKDMQMKTRTLIWTAGARANALYEAWGFSVDKRGRVEVDPYLHVKNESKIFVIGDAAITTYSGYAQTALYDGKYVARVIASSVLDKLPPVYSPKQPVNAIPAGEGWAGVLINSFGLNMRFYGTIGWWFRRAADLRSFMLVLPLLKAMKIFLGGCLNETCNICAVDTAHAHD